MNAKNVIRETQNALVGIHCDADKVHQRVTTARLELDKAGEELEALFTAIRHLDRLLEACIDSQT